MNKVRNALRFAALVFLIFLACLGMGIAGAVPIPFSSPKRDAEREKNEYVERPQKRTPHAGATYRPG
ncbi:MAG: hypothetical protein EP344_06505 [Bacteroidetes bacterium]|nr:MAG: hypothetical protein EP344_06505 [Bacteroidota bacterium]